MNIRLNFQSLTNRIRRCRTLWLMVLAIVLFAAFPSGVGVSAANVSVDINGRSFYTQQDLLHSGVTYVPLRSFAMAVHDGFAVSWSAASKTATLREDGYLLQATVGRNYITVNGQRVYSSASNRLIGNRIHIPVRSLCQAMGLDISWNAARQRVSVSGQYEDNNHDSTTPNAPPTSNDTAVDSDDLYWLARIISAESRGEPMAGKIAVGTVVMNRVRHTQYPNTVYGVIFDKKFGTQFTPTANGSIYREPTAESIEAAQRVLNGERTDSRILFFVNESIVPNNWITNNRVYIMKIGNHTFYA